MSGAGAGVGALASEVAAAVCTGPSLQPRRLRGRIPPALAAPLHATLLGAAWLPEGAGGKGDSKCALRAMLYSVSGATDARTRVPMVVPEFNFCIRLATSHGPCFRIRLPKRAATNARTSRGGRRLCTPLGQLRQHKKVLDCTRQVVRFYYGIARQMRQPVGGDAPASCVYTIVLPYTVM